LRGIVTFLLVTGHLGWGLALALVVGVLDGLDGKRARIKIETTKSGKIEHWFDALFEMSWWIALAWHFQVSGQLPGAFGYLLLLIVAEGVDGLAKGSVHFTTGKLIDELGAFRAPRSTGGRTAKCLRLDPDERAPSRSASQSFYFYGVATGRDCDCASAKRNTKFHSQPPPIQYSLTRLSPKLFGIDLA
jgi:hypothetical protein